MQHKSKKIFSELSTFFKNNDNGDAIFSVSRVMDTDQLIEAIITENDKINSFAAALSCRDAA